MSYNRLLSALSPRLYEKLFPSLTPIELSQGTVLHVAGEVIEHLYFPVDCLISITITMEDGRSAETGVIGNREMVGINAFMGGRETTQTDYVVQISGRALKAPASEFREEFERNQELRQVFLNATQAFIAQLSQTTACNRLHVLDRRLARWLLEAHDRIGSSHIMLTQGIIAEMLGVRRAGVTQAAQKLQSENLIRYDRGHIQIINQEGLECAACECIRVLRQEYDRLLGPKYQRENIDEI